MSKTLSYTYRINDDVKAARNCGGRKNHVQVEVFAVGKWRTMGFWTRKQLGKTAAWSAIRLRLLRNSGLPLDTKVEFNVE